MEGSEKECLFCCFCGTTFFEARIRRVGLIRDTGTRVGFGFRVSACDGMVKLCGPRERRIELSVTL